MKKSLIFLFSANMCFCVMAQSKLDAYTKMYLANRQKNVTLREGMFPKSEKIGGQETILTIVTLNDRNVLPDLQDVDGTIETQIGDMLIVRVPIDNIEKMSEADEIKLVQVERLYKQLNSNSRILTNQNKVNEATDASGNQLTGKGVLVGVIDGGFEFNHINFKDADGNSRVK